jgi:hypothetical protein
MPDAGMETRSVQKQKRKPLLGCQAMNRAVLIVGLIVIATPALAQKRPPFWINPVLRWAEPMRHPSLPPLQFDRKYEGRMFVHRGSMFEVKVACFRETDILGCAFRSFHGERCDVWIVNDEELERFKADYDIVWRHERGHCNGWKHEPRRLE